MDEPFEDTAVFVAVPSKEKIVVKQSEEEVVDDYVKLPVLSTNQQHQQHLRRQQQQQQQHHHQEATEGHQDEKIIKSSSGRQRLQRKRVFALIWIALTSLGLCAGFMLSLRLKVTPLNEDLINASHADNANTIDEERTKMSADTIDQEVSVLNENAKTQDIAVSNKVNDALEVFRDAALGDKHTPEVLQQQYVLERSIVAKHQPDSKLIETAKVHPESQLIETAKVQPESKLIEIVKDQPALKQFAIERIETAKDQSALEHIAKHQPAPERRKDVPLYFLTRKSFGEFLLDHDDVFIHFFNWSCKWCKHPLPTWKTFADHVHQSNLPVKVAAVDCMANLGFCKELGVTDFPTYRWYNIHKKELPVEYEDDRTVERFLAFTRERLSLRQDSVLA